MKPMKHRHALRSQRGLTMLMVMLLMTVMLMGALAFARVTEVGTLVSRNLAVKDSSFHAAEVGRGVAFAALQALVDKDNDADGWYWAKMQPINAATGLPSGINFTTTPTVPGNVGRFKVTYAVERLCNVNAVKDSSLECVVLNKPAGNSQKGDAAGYGYNDPEYLTVGARQYRITVLVTDERNTSTWTQSLVTVD